VLVIVDMDKNMMRQWPPLITSIYK